MLKTSGSPRLRACQHGTAQALWTRGVPRREQSWLTSLPGSTLLSQRRFLWWDACSLVCKSWPEDSPRDCFPWPLILETKGGYIFDPLLTQCWEQDKRSCTRSTATVLGARASDMEVEVRCLWWQRPSQSQTSAE